MIQALIKQQTSNDSFIGLITNQNNAVSFFKFIEASLGKKCVF